ncbi:MAG: O-Antigen ligase [Gaiellales bacterium]|nr:O-Antigen ligase [Gaiellales bacterium]
MPRFERDLGPALESAAATLLATSVILTAFGSSSVAGLTDVGRPLRWVALFLLGATAAALALVSRHGRPGRLLAHLAAVALGLGALAIVSAGYSIEPRLSLERGVSFLFAVSTASLLGYAAEVRPGLTRLLLAGALAGTIAAAAGGLLVYAFAPSDAVQHALPDVPPRWRGLGENPNTISLLAAVGIGGAAWFAATSDRWRAIWVAGAAGLAVTILASGSRGAFVAGVGGMVVVAATLPPRRRRRLGLTAATIAVAAIGVVAVDAIAKPGKFAAAAQSSPPTTKPSGSGSGAGSGAGSGNAGPPAPPARTFTSVGSSGRIDAWRLAFHIGNGRPALGYGFGTEETVFGPSRFQNFQGRRPENSFLGLYLQLGAAGVLLLFGALLAIAVSVFVAFRQRVSEAPALAGVLVGAAALLFVQSYVYSVGNVATMIFWISAMLMAARAGASR